MKTFVAFAVLLVTVSAHQEYEYEPYPQAAVDEYPEWYLRGQEAVEARHRRDVSLTHPVGKDGKVFGTLGQNDNGLFGKAGYNHQIFNDHRGQLDGQAYGSRVLGPYGDSSHLGGGLNWKNDHAAANLDISKQIHGAASVNAAAGGRWPLGKNGDVTAQGFYRQTQGMGRDYGGMANLNYTERKSDKNTLIFTKIFINPRTTNVL